MTPPGDGMLAAAPSPELRTTIGAAPSFAVKHYRLLAVAGAVVTAVAVAVAAAGAPSDAAFGRGLLELLIVGLPILAGLYALRTPLNTTFGLALYGIGFAWSLTALGESSSSALYTAGRLADWLVFPCVVYVLVAFPDGRIGTRLDRLVLAAVIAVTVVLFYGTAPLVVGYPPHTPWATCITDCPPNAVSVVDSPPSFMTNVIYAREWLVIAIWVGLYVSMARRWRGALPLRRRAIAPVFGAGAVLGLLHVSFHLSREADAPAGTIENLGDAWTLCIVVVCGACLVGLVWQRIALAGALRELGLTLRRSHDPESVRAALAEALRDPTVALAYRDAASMTWRDGNGDTVDWPAAALPGRTVSPIRDHDGRLAAALAHDAALTPDPELLEGVGALVLAGHHHVDVHESRRRLAVEESADRVRLERDLHDGAQQFLLALRFRLSELARLVQGSTLDARVAELVEVADATAEEIHRISHGIYPAALVEGGVGDAIAELPRLPGISLRVDDEGVGRLPLPAERALYYAAVEAVQNAVKHAHASEIRVVLRRRRDRVEVVVADNGDGFDPAAVESSTGLLGMRDRIEGVGGTLEISSSLGHRTTVRIALPAT